MGDGMEDADLGNLENLLTPFCYGDIEPMPKTNPGSPPVPDNFHLRQFLSQDCQWGCLYNGSVIKCFPVDSRYGEGTVRGQVPIAVSTDSYQFPLDTFVSCVTEIIIHNQRISSGLSKLLVGLNIKNNMGALVIFDPIRGKPLKWISLPHPATSVTVLSHFEEGGSNRPFFNEAMMAMVGIAAVGMQGGQVLIIDLGLDDPNLNTFQHHNHHHNSAGSNHSFSDNASNLTPFDLILVDPHEHIIATKRHHAVAKKELIYLSVINEAEDEDVEMQNFHYCTPNGETMMITAKQNVTVTSVEYIASIGSLVVGFGFGCFQIWRVDDMNLIFSSNWSRNEAEHQIFGFSFIQPVDDPKNYCYLWVLFGRRGREFCQSYVELHCLNFEEKPEVKNFGYTYDGLKQCVRRLTFKLEDYFDEPNADDSTEDGGDYRYHVRPLRMWTQPDSNLTFFAWESSRNGIYYMGIFDLNQWYSNHTLEFIRNNPLTGLCPYWVYIPIESFDPESVVGDVRLVPKSLERWENPHMKLDVHLYPASLSFQAVCVTSSAVATFQHFGLQEKLIRKLISDGNTLMVQPATIRRIFKTYGLQPVFPLRYPNYMSQEDADRYFIFSVLMESRRSSVIIQFASMWLDGSYTNVGCTLDLILDWITSYTFAVRVMATEHWENLFNFKNEVLPPETSHFINYSNYLWNSLHGLLTTIMRPEEVYSVRGTDVEDLEFGLTKLVQYSAALLMVHKSEILPERDEMDVISVLLANHGDRRQEVKDALEQCPFIDPSLKNIRPMMIDYLLEAFDEDLVRDQWNVAPGEDLYPPRHVGYVLNMFMWAHENPKDIARVIAYFLLDVSNVINGGERMKSKLRGDFLSVMKLSGEEQTEVYNLWVLDHGGVKEPLVYMSQKDRFVDSDELPWCPAVVVCTALGYDDDVLEILERSCPHQLKSLRMNLMSKSPSQYKKLCDSICSLTSNMEQEEEMLTNFFKVSTEWNCLGEFIKNKLRVAPPIVVDSLIQFLGDNRSFENDDKLLSIYIHLEDYKNVEEKYQKMKKKYEGKLTMDQRLTWMIREGLVKHLLGTMRKPNMVLQFLKSSGPQMVLQNKPAIKIKPHKMPAVECPMETFNVDDIQLPPQLRRLKLLQSKPSNPLSPLRRYVGRLHTVISASNFTTPTASGRGNVTLNFESPDQSPNNSLDLDSVSMSKKSVKRNSSPVPDNQDQSLFLGGDRDLEMNFGNNETLNRSHKSPVNLQRLLQVPSVDHRVSRRSISTFATPIGKRFGEYDDDDNNRSMFFTPGGPFNSDGELQVHSIMKKEDSVSRRRDKLRFLDLSESFESDSSEVVSSDRREIDDSSSVLPTRFNLSMTDDDGHRNVDQGYSENKKLERSINQEEQTDADVSACVSEILEEVLENRLESIETRVSEPQSVDSATEYQVGTSPAKQDDLVKVVRRSKERSPAINDEIISTECSISERVVRRSSRSKSLERDKPIVSSDKQIIKTSKNQKVKLDLSEDDDREVFSATLVEENVKAPRKRASSRAKSTEREKPIMSSDKEIVNNETSRNQKRKRNPSEEKGSDAFAATLISEDMETIESVRTPRKRSSSRAKSTEREKPILSSEKEIVNKETSRNQKRKLNLSEEEEPGSEVVAATPISENLESVTTPRKRSSSRAKSMERDKTIVSSDKETARSRKRKLNLSEEKESDVFDATLISEDNETIESVPAPRKRASSRAKSTERDKSIGSLDKEIVNKQTSQHQKAQLNLSEEKQEVFVATTISEDIESVPKPRKRSSSRAKSTERDRGVSLDRDDSTKDIGNRKRTTSEGKSAEKRTGSRASSMEPRATTTERAMIIEKQDDDSNMELEFNVSGRLYEYENEQQTLEEHKSGSQKAVNTKRHSKSKQNDTTSTDGIDTITKSRRPLTASKASEEQDTSSIFDMTTDNINIVKTKQRSTKAPTITEKSELPSVDEDEGNSGPSTSKSSAKQILTEVEPAEKRIGSRATSVQPTAKAPSTVRAKSIEKDDSNPKLVSSAGRRLHDESEEQPREHKSESQEAVKAKRQSKSKQNDTTSTDGVSIRSKRTSKPSKASDEHDTSSIFDISTDNIVKTKRRSTRSKTPTIITESELPVVDEEEDNAEPSTSPSSVNRMLTRSKSKTPSPTKSEKSGGSSADAGRSKRRRPATVFNYCPNLSTVLEDSTVELSILEKSIVPPPPLLSSPTSKGRKGRKKAEQVDSEQVESEEIDSKPRKRSRKSIIPSDELETTLVDDDDAKSDISTRSTRSTRSNRSTGSSSTKKTGTRSRKLKSAPV